MLNIVFSDSALGSLKVAQSCREGGVIGGATSVILLREDGTVKLIRRAETPEDYFATMLFE